MFIPEDLILVPNGSQAYSGEHIGGPLKKCQHASFFTGLTK